MKFAAIFILTFLSLTAFSQKADPIIKFCPLALLDDVSFPTVQAGLEVRLSKRFSWYNEVGIKYRKSAYEFTDTSILSSGGFKLKTELRFYFRRRSKKTMQGMYLAANAFFTRDIHNTQIYYFKDSSANSDVFGVKKNVLGFNAIFGYQKLLSKKFGLDIYAGPGVRFRNVHTVAKEYNAIDDNIVRSIDINIPSIRNDADATEGNSVVPNLSFGVRLIYKL